MKKGPTFTLLASALILLLQVGYGQSSACEDLKKENEYLRNALKITTPVKTVTSSKVDFNFIKCEGNTKEQTITLTLTLVNRGANTTFQFQGAVVIDVEANEFKTYDINIGSGSTRNTIYTDIPVKTTLVFKKVLPATKLLKLVSISYFDLENPGRQISFEYKDIAIMWK